MKGVREAIIKELEESANVKRMMARVLSEEIARAAQMIAATLMTGGKILLLGNGGSAADAQHLAAEFVSRYAFDRPGLAAIAFTTDTSMLTAIGNDYGYEQIFRRQLQSNGRQGDIFIGISTSGNSPNVLAALQCAKELGITAVGLTGQGETKMREHCDYCIRVPSESTPRIQESHIMLGHIICGIVEDALFGNAGG